MLRVLTLSTLFPDATRPNFGIFVERQTTHLAALADIDLRVVAPLGLAPFPLDRLSHQRHRLALPMREDWHGLDVVRPRFRAVPGVRGRWHVRSLERALVPVLDAIRPDFPFDVIDAQFFFPDGPAAVALGRRYGVPVSVKARGADIHHWGRNPATAQHVRRAGCEADGLLAVSAAMAHDIAALGIDTPVHVHRTGIDRARFGTMDRAAARSAIGIDGPLIVSLGALIPRKGHDVAIDAVAAIPDAQLWIVGEGPERTRLAARIAERGLGDRVRLAGAMPHDALPALLSAADVTVLASTSEGLANAWVESLASGTPVVTTDVGGARELIDRPAAGHIVERTPAAFSAAIAKVLASPPAAEAVRTTVDRYSWDTNARELRTHLLGLVQARG